LGFTAGRNRKLEEERSPEGLEEVEKKLAHPKNHFSKREQAKDFCCFEEQSY
jgi:hypothetical protein